MKDYIFEIGIRVAIIIVLCIIFYGGCSAITAPEWNDGVCIDCGVHYELRAVSRYYKYYACPNCGKEVVRP